MGRSRDLLDSNEASIIYECRVFEGFGCTLFVIIGFGRLVAVTSGSYR